MPMMATDCRNGSMSRNPNSQTAAQHNRDTMWSHYANPEGDSLMAEFWRPRRLEEGFSLASHFTEHLIFDQNTSHK
jgi:hypothetical protein